MNIRRSMSNLIEHLDSCINSSSITGILTGIDSIDSRIKGFQPGELVVIGDISSSRAGDLLTKIVAHAALLQDKSIMFFSMEKAELATIGSIISSLYNIRPVDLLTGNLDNQEWDLLVEIVPQLINTKIYLDYSRCISLKRLIQKVQKRADETKLELIAIDNLQLIDTEDGRSPREQAELIFINLNKTAKEISCPIILTTKLQDTISLYPKITDIPFCSTVEPLIDTVLLLKHDWEWHSYTEQLCTDIIIEKSRNPIKLVAQVTQTQLYYAKDNHTQ